MVLIGVLWGCTLIRPLLSCVRVKCKISGTHDCWPLHSSDLTPSINHRCVFSILVVTPSPFLCFYPQFSSNLHILPTVLPPNILSSPGHPAFHPSSIKFSHQIFPSTSLTCPQHVIPKVGHPNMARNQNPGALMNIEIGGKWTFIPPKYGNFIGFDPSPHRGTKLLLALHPI